MSMSAVSNRDGTFQIFINLHLLLLARLSPNIELHVHTRDDVRSVTPVRKSRDAGAPTLARSPSDEAARSTERITVTLFTLNPSGRILI